ncbi:hypothetical protein Agub_g5535 [Astrephomene gubernaculifera]|uniref:Dolichyl-diphosphooligosaccharide--protein glycosyltransferase subunit 3 n=1 Tax=Astrephomene gubernaculifera TaxID=47775 RepID=A0AAD3DPN2_9CHLO|nr:hypothetical protein Agub_g5535 [Astrephomene gubernaculifera]
MPCVDKKSTTMKATLILCMMALVALSASVSATMAPSELASELASMRHQFRDAVIPLTDDLLQRFVVGRSRPYAVAIFFTAQQVVDSNPGLRLDDLRREYGLAAKAFASGPDADKVFFFEAGLEVSQTPFGMLQVNALPCVVRIPPGLAITSTKAPLELPRSEKMLPDTIGTRDYPWPAETFVDFIGTRHGVTAAAVDRPSFVKSPMFPFVVLGAVVTVLYLAYKALTTQMALLRSPVLWAVLSLAVFWFSASGGMYNIIRGVPFFIRDRNGKIQFFMTGRQGQLGAEGFTLGTLYLVASCGLAFVTYLAPRIASAPLRNLLSLLGALMAAGSVYQTFTLWTMKTGYKHVFYF